MMDTHEQPSENDPQLSDFFEELEAKVDCAVKTYQAELKGFFAGLGTAVDIAKRAQAELDRIAATQFSVFRYFNTRELDLSRIFADLLDPSGRHGQGDHFLRLFLDSDKLPRALSSSLPGRNLGECRVHLEFPTREGRRIDIVLEMPDNLWIGIENKPWAKDQDWRSSPVVDQRHSIQIKDYLNDLKSRSRETAWILYFSGEGKNPSKWSELTPEERERCPTVPYRSDNDVSPSLEHWIEKCSERCEAETVRWFLKDLLKYIRMEFRTPGQRLGESLMTKDNDTVARFIRNNPTYMELAFKVEKAAPRIREEAVRKVLKRVEERLSKRFADGQWAVKFLKAGRPRQPQAVRIKKHSWQCVAPGWESWEGIRLDRDWRGPIISVSRFRELKMPEIEQILKHHIGLPQLRDKDYFCCCLEGDLKDWNGADFVFRAWHKPEKIAKDLAEKMEILAIEIDKILPG